MASVTFVDAIGSGPDWSLVKPDENVFNFVHQAAANAMSYLSDSAKQIYDNSADIYKMVNYSTAMRQARAVVRKLANNSRNNEVTELRTMGQLQNASPVMQRFIMADPITRALYQEDGCSGYADSYVDYNVGKIGKDHYDYRRVMNGMWYEDEDTGQVRMDSFYEDTEGDVDLDPLAQMDILRTWDFVRAKLKEGKEDPVSPHNEML